jgi:hypothetical protein
MYHNGLTEEGEQSPSFYFKEDEEQSKNSNHKFNSDPECDSILGRNHTCTMTDLSIADLWTAAKYTKIQMEIYENGKMNEVEWKKWYTLHTEINEELDERMLDMRDSEEKEWYHCIHSGTAQEVNNEKG